MLIWLLVEIDILGRELVVVVGGVDVSDVAEERFLWQGDLDDALGQGRRRRLMRMIVVVLGVGSDHLGADAEIVLSLIEGQYKQ